MSVDPTERTTTGSDALDAVLDGGLPAGRATALVGPPGTLKRPLALQFLAAGGSSLYLSLATDAESAAALRSAAGYAAADLSVASVEAPQSGSLADAVGAEVAAADDPERVVVDGVEPTAEDADAALQRVASRLSGTTTLLLGDRGDLAVGAGVHGLLGTERAPEHGRPTLTVRRLYGADYDPRPVELRPADPGVAVGPRDRGLPDAVRRDARRSTGVAGLDALCGGGLVLGRGALLRHDGRADLATLVGATVASAVGDGYAVELLPALDLRADRLDAVLSGYDASLEALLEADRLAVLDAVGAWEAGRTNVFDAGDDADELRGKLQGVTDRTDRPHLRIVDADAMVHTLGHDGARRIRNFQEAALLGPEDALLHVQNPAVVGDEIGALYADVSAQVLETTLTSDGRQHVAVRKSPDGTVGRRSVLEFTDRPPFVAATAPPGGD